MAGTPQKTKIPNFLLVFIIGLSQLDIVIWWKIKLNLKFRAFDFKKIRTRSGVNRFFHPTPDATLQWTGHAKLVYY